MTIPALRDRQKTHVPELSFDEFTVDTLRSFCNLPTQIIQAQCDMLELMGAFTEAAADIAKAYGDAVYLATAPSRAAYVKRVDGVLKSNFMRAPYKYGLEISDVVVLRTRSACVFG